MMKTRISFTTLWEKKMCISFDIYPLKRDWVIARSRAKRFCFGHGPIISVNASHHMTSSLFNQSQKEDILFPLLFSSYIWLMNHMEWISTWYLEITTDVGYVSSVNGDRLARPVEDGGVGGGSGGEPSGGRRGTSLIPPPFIKTSNFCNFSVMLL